jgi:hypothetical protein
MCDQVSNSVLIGARHRQHARHRAAGYLFYTRKDHTDSSNTAARGGRTLASFKLS